MRKVNEIEKLNSLLGQLKTYDISKVKNTISSLSSIYGKEKK